MKKILGLLTSQERSLRRTRQQLHTGKPFQPAPDWDGIILQEQLEAVGGKDHDQAIGAYLKHPELSDSMVRHAVMATVRTLLDPYATGPEMGRIELATLQAILEEERIPVDERVEVLALTWASKTGLQRGLSGFGETWGSAKERHHIILRTARRSRNREMVLGAEFMYRIGSMGLSRLTLQAVVENLLAPCEDEVLEVLWALVEDTVQGGEALGFDRVRELIEQAQLVLR